MTGTTFAAYVADNIPIMCWMADADGGIHWFSQAWYEYTGLTPDAADGWGWRAVIDPALLPEVLVRWTGGLQAKTPFELVVPLRGADGVLRPFLTRVRPTLSGDRVSSWFGSHTDVGDLMAESGAMRSQLESLGSKAGRL